jgi:hypothetical protein
MLGLVSGKTSTFSPLICAATPASQQAAVALGVNERKAIRHTLLRGTDYWFCLGADLDNARVAIHVYDERRRSADVDDWQNGSHAAARTLSLVTATYYIVVEVEDSSAERTHWAMVYASKPIRAAKPLSARKLKAEE